MSEYKDILFKWAERHLEKGAIVTDVTIFHEEGYRYSSMTYQDPYDEIRIHYRLPGGKHDNYCLYLNMELDNMPDFGTLLSELFALAEGEDSE